MTDQETDLDLQVVDVNVVNDAEDMHRRELKLKEMFADAPAELKGIIEEAKKEPIEDLIELKKSDHSEE